MKKINLVVFCVLFIFGMASCATTGTKEVATGSETGDQEVRLEEEDDVRSLADALGMSDNGTKSTREVDIESTTPTSDAFRTNYLEFGPDAVQFIVSIPNNTDQEINAIIWLCDERTVNTNIFDLRTYPDEYKEKYLIAIMPYEFETSNVRVRDIKDSVGDVVSFVKVIAEENRISLNRIILVGYTPGHFSMAYL